MFPLEAAPSVPSIKRNRLSDADVGSHQHPQTSIPSLDNHMFIKVTARKIGLPEQIPGLTLVCGGVHIGKAKCAHIIADDETRLETAPNRRGSQPGSVAQHGWLVHHNAVENSLRLGPSQRCR
jgi:hypothetical protein